MNTANLQLEGLLLAVSSVLETMRRKGLLTEQEIVDALGDAETRTRSRPEGEQDLSDANLDAIQFPIRFLKAATNLTASGQASFTKLAAMVGETKP